MRGCHLSGNRCQIQAFGVDSDNMEKGISNIGMVFYGLALASMLGGVCYYIVVGSKKGDLNPFHAVRFIAFFVVLGMIFATIAVMVQ